MNTSIICSQGELAGNYLARSTPAPRRQLTRPFVGAVLLAILTLSSLSRAECDSCLSALETHVRRFDEVLIQDSSGTIIRGQLLAIDQRQASLQLSERGSHRVREFEIARDKVISLGYRKAGKPKPYLIIAGFFVGQLVGKVVEHAFDPSYEIRMEILPFRRPKGNEDGTWFGGIAGFVAGLALPMLVPANRVIPCTDNQSLGKK
jgi:hypothetical protein